MNRSVRTVWITASKNMWWNRLKRKRKAGLRVTRFTSLAVRSHSGAHDLLTSKLCLPSNQLLVSHEFHFPSGPFFVFTEDHSSRRFCRLKSQSKCSQTSYPQARSHIYLWHGVSVTPNEDLWIRAGWQEERHSSIFLVQRETWSEVCAGEDRARLGA